MKSPFTILPLNILAFLALIVLGLSCRITTSYANQSTKIKEKPDAGSSNAPKSIIIRDVLVRPSGLFLHPTKSMSNQNKSNTRAFTAPKNIDEYLEVLNTEYHKICHDDDKWSHFNGFNGLDPHNLQLKAIYDMLRHVMFKLTTTHEDVVTAAFAERDWILAENEIDTNNWRMSHSPVVDDEDKTDSKKELEKLSEAVISLSNTVIELKKQVQNKFQPKETINDKLTSLFNNTDDAAVRNGIIKLLKRQKRDRVIAAITQKGIGMEDLIA